MSSFSLERTFLLYYLGMDVVLGCLVEYIIMSFWVYTLHGYTVQDLICGHFSRRKLCTLFGIKTSVVATLKISTIFKYWVFVYGAICILLGLFYSILSVY